MIAIVRVTQRGHPHPIGEQSYEVRINATVIATFRHKRDDGLTKCLQLAAEAVERKKWEDPWSTLPDPFVNLDWSS
jgi:hypothetical protein